MRPLVAFTGQGVARADGFNLTRRLKALAGVDAVLAAVPWKDRQNLDELFAACGALGRDELDELVRAARAMCLKERRATQRKVAHRALFETLAEVAQTRLVVHLTANVDGLTSTFAVRDFGAIWPPYTGPASVDEVARAAAALFRRGRGFLHLPVHGEAALVQSRTNGCLLRTFYGEPSALHENGPWVSTLAEGIGTDVRKIAEALPFAALGFQLLRALVLGEEIVLGGGPAVALGRADLVAIGYGAGSRPARALYPFERCIDELVTLGAPAAPQRFAAVLYDARECEPSARWYREHGFAVSSYGDGELGARVRQALLQARPGERSDASPQERAGARGVTARAESTRPLRTAQ